MPLLCAPPGRSASSLSASDLTRRAASSRLRSGSSQTPISTLEICSARPKWQCATTCSQRRRQAKSGLLVFKPSCFDIFVRIPITSRAVRRCIFRKNPTMQMHSLAAKLGCSARHLSRVFNAAFGVGPKRFARLARFQKILAERRNGRSWAQVAYACGLTDQAHLVREFQDIVGEAPTDFFTHELLHRRSTEWTKPTS